MGFQGGGGIPLSPTLPPIGAVIAWLKSYTNTPALPTGWIECNGQAITNNNSIFNGQNAPDLNGTDVFLRGNDTSGVTGGTSVHQHAITIAGGTYYLSGAVADAVNGVGGTTNGTGYTQNSATIPPFYSVVWIMRIL